MENIESRAEQSRAEQHSAEWSRAEQHSAEQRRAGQKVQLIEIAQLGGLDSLYGQDCTGAAGTKRKAVSGRTPPENPGICLD